MMHATCTSRLTWLAWFTVACSMSASGVCTAAGAPLEQIDVYFSGHDGYHTFRIPSVIVTKQGTVLAFCEGRRHSSSDTNDIDLLVKRSRDGGKTFSKAQVLWDDGPNTCGNPCPVVDQRTGTIVLLMTHNLGSDHEPQIIARTSKGTRTVWKSESRDDGLTWSRPVEITSSAKKGDWTWYATGPGAGIQLKTGRLVIPCDHIEARTERMNSHIIYSDDGGATWRLGGTAGPGTNECEVVERTDGSLLLNMRNYDRRQTCRAVATSSDGGLTWSAPAHDKTLIEPVCQASIRRFSRADGDGKSRILFSNPASEKSRKSMTVRLSCDEGRTWPVSKLIHGGPAAYSCLAVMPDGKMLCLYERGDRSAYEKITLARFDLAWLSGEAAGKQEAKGNRRPTVHLVSAIDVKDFGAETLRIGDLDGDGGPDLLFTQSGYGTREITCLTATTIFGRVLWQTGKPSADNGRIYSDLPVQIYDWDNDGANEVLYVRQAKYAEPPHDGRSVRERATRYEGHATMVVLDGATGREKAHFDLPAPADDCFLFADLTGRGRREDLVVKDRYWNMWGVDHAGKVLWHWAGSTGHFPAIADVDNDGRDEVFVGFALIDHDGKVLFSKDPKGHHQDAAYIVRPADGKWRLLFGNSGIHCLTPEGRVLWHHPLGECQHVVAGRFRNDSEMQFAVVDRTPVPSHRRDANAWGILYLYDLNGREIWRRQQEKGDWAIAPLAIRWMGLDCPRSILVYGLAPGRPAVVYDGNGRITDEFPMRLVPGRTDADRPAEFYALVADVWGDSREEVLLFGARGACIYANARLAPVETQYNETLYPGM